MELMLDKTSKILALIGWIVLIIAVLFTIEIAFVAGLLSLALWVVEFGGDLAPISLISNIQSYLLQFALIMFGFSLIMWALKRYARYCKEKRERHQQAWQEDRQKFLDEVKNAVKDDEIQIDWIDLTGLAKKSWHERKIAENKHFEEYHKAELKKLNNKRRRKR